MGHKWYFLGKTENKLRLKEYRRKYCLSHRKELGEYYKKWRKENRDKIMKHYYENREKIIDAHKKYNQINKEKINSKRIKNRYGITMDQYNSLMLQQNNLCAICLTPGSSKRKFSIDHNHLTGKVRGLLCNLCNTALGKFGDSETLLIAAMKYLQKHDGNKIMLKVV